MQRKVFARFHQDNKNNLTYRTNTILQFGDSWDIIGAAILTNPGTAIIAQETVSDTDLKHLEPLAGTREGWNVVNYSRDATIRDWLPRIFNGYFALQGEHELNGIILLYNLFNIKSQDLNKAVELYKNAESPFLHTTEEDIKQINQAPIVYLGWGNVAKNRLFQEEAKKLFSAIKPDLRSHYDPIFENNTFYHPHAIQLGYKGGKVQSLISAFYKHLTH